MSKDPTPTLPEEVLFHAGQWLEEYRSATSSQRHLLQYCQDAAAVIESRAYAALVEAGIRPIHVIAGADQETIRRNWLTEAVHQQNCFPMFSPRHLAFAAIIYASELRDALETPDAERAALAMMAMVAAALRAGFNLVESEAGLARRSREGASEGGKARAKLFDDDRVRVRELALSEWQKHPAWSQRRVAQSIAKKTQIAINRVYWFVRHAG